MQQAGTHNVVRFRDGSYDPPLRTPFEPGFAAAFEYAWRPGVRWANRIHCDAVVPHVGGQSPRETNDPGLASPVSRAPRAHE